MLLGAFLITETKEDPHGQRTLDTLSVDTEQQVNVDEWTTFLASDTQIEREIHTSETTLPSSATSKFNNELDNDITDLELKKGLLRTEEIASCKPKLDITKERNAKILTLLPASVPVTDGSP